MLRMSASPRISELNSASGSGTPSPDVSTGMSSYLSKLMPVGLPPPNRRASVAASSRMSPWKPMALTLPQPLERP